MFVAPKTKVAKLWMSSSKWGKHVKLVSMNVGKKNNLIFVAINFFEICLIFTLYAHYLGERYKNHDSEHSTRNFKLKQSLMDVLLTRQLH